MRKQAFPERLGILPRVTQRVSGGTRTQAQVCVTPSPCLSMLHSAASHTGLPKRGPGGRGGRGEEEKGSIWVSELTLKAASPTALLTKRFKIPLKQIIFIIKIIRLLHYIRKMQNNRRLKSTHTPQLCSVN